MKFGISDLFVIRACAGYLLAPSILALISINKLFANFFKNKFGVFGLISVPLHYYSPRQKAKSSQKPNVMYTLNDLTAMTKGAIAEIAINLQNSANPATQFRVIPAVPEVPAAEASTNKETGIITPAKDAVPAVPAVSITDQLLATPEGIAYKAACDAIDVANKAASESFAGNEQTKTIQTAKDNALAFRTANADTISQIDALNKQLIAENDKMKAKNANMRAIKTAITGINSQIDTLEAKLTYPADYDLSFEELPTYTPTAYPNIDTFFPNGITGNFPASFLLGKKVAKSASTGTKSASTSTGEKSAWAELPKETKDEIRAFIKANSTLSNPEILTALQAKFPAYVGAIEAAGNTKLIWVTLNK